MGAALKISVITVCYNSVRTIEETIVSVINQRDANVEYLVIDGGSTDGTLNVLQKYQAHIDKIVSEPDNGIYDAMNKGLALASGDIVGFLNADDLFAEDCVLKNIAELFENFSPDACFGDLIYFSSPQQKTVRYWQSSAFKAGAFARGWSPAHPTFYVKRAIYQQYGGFNLAYPMGNDIELMMRLLEKHRIKSIYLPLVMVKMRLGGVSNQSIKNIVIQNKSIFEAANHLKLRIRWGSFIFCKMGHRFSQFIFKNRSLGHNVN